MQYQQNVQSPLIKLDGIGKNFGQNVVLKDICLEADGGDVVAVIGGNGAGKSTLMKIIMGIHPHYKGDIYLRGEKVILQSPSASLANGIYLVPQEPMLFPNMTVEENILLGFKEPRAQLHARLSELVEQLGWNLSLDRRADSLSIAEQQLVELMRGMLRNAKILILDEPTSALTFGETQSLFRIVADLRAKGICIFYITHRLSEVFEIATRVVILRDGVITVSGTVDQFTLEDLIAGLLPPNTEMPEGDGVAREISSVDYENAQPILKIHNLCGYGFTDINLDVYPNEILGIAGVVGAGRTELAESIFGIDSVISGEVLLQEENITNLHPEAVIKKGLNYVPEDRHLNAIFGIRDVVENISAGMQDRFSKFFTNDAAERDLADKFIRDFRIKVTGRDQLIASLSGGNQQKVVLSKILATEPKVVVFDEPTRGIDAAARGDIYRIIHQLRDQGVAIILISSDIEEVVLMSDRVATMYHGSINHTFSGKDITIDNLTAASFGVEQEEDKAV